jgi:hypothetical protein
MMYLQDKSAAVSVAAQVLPAVLLLLQPKQPLVTLAALGTGR